MNSLQSNTDSLSDFDKFENERLRIEKVSNRILLWTILVPLVLFGSLFLFDETLPTILFTVITIMAIWGVYHNSVNIPYNKLTSQIRERMVSEYMSIYYPQVNFNYNRLGNSAQSIIKKTGLVKANKFDEEDVIKGSLDNIVFYLSEVNLKWEHDNFKLPVFKGFLMQLKITQSDLPITTIESKLGLIKRTFGGTIKNKEYGFWTNSINQKESELKLRQLYPFFRHLMKNGNDVRIYTEKDEIIFLMSSEIEFLDDPKPNLNLKFDKKIFSENLTKNLNSLFFILKSIAENKKEEEIEEELKLNLEQHIERTILKSQ